MECTRKRISDFACVFYILIINKLSMEVHILSLFIDQKINLSQGKRQIVTYKLITTQAVVHKNMVLIDKKKRMTMV